MPRDGALLAIPVAAVRMRSPVSGCVLLLWGWVAASAAPATPAASPREATFSSEAYARVLSKHVDDRGLVDYRGLKADPADLDAFLVALARLDPGVYGGWSDREKIAFWINAYNALTLRVIADHYPIRASVLRSLVYPRNSIRQIPGVWTELTFEVLGRSVTLDEIEHAILRKEFREPRIHMALVCAARSCPPLRREPYAGEVLDRQLEDQTRRFLADTEKFRLDEAARTVYLSPIFEWFGEDFLAAYGPGRIGSGRTDAERAVLSFVAQRLPSGPGRKLAQRRWTVSYLDYDWSLNERP